MDDREREAWENYYAACNKLHDERAAIAEKAQAMIVAADDAYFLQKRAMREAHIAFLESLRAEKTPSQPATAGEDS